MRAMIIYNTKPARFSFWFKKKKRNLHMPTNYRPVLFVSVVFLGPSRREASGQLCPDEMTVMDDEPDMGSIQIFRPMFNLGPDALFDGTSFPFAIRFGL